jgi:hypothetical protein
MIKINSFFSKSEQYEEKNFYSENELKKNILNIFQNTSKYDDYPNEEGKFVKSFKINSILTLFSIHISNLTTIKGKK